MKKIAFAVHGGMGKSTTFLKKNQKAFEAGLEEAVVAGYNLLKKGASALDAVELAVKILEDNPLFNAGRGSALNADGEVEMDAAIMDGKHLDAGAVSMVRLVKNPVSLARLVMEKTPHVFLSGYGAIDFAKYQNIPLESERYFFSESQSSHHEDFLHGTVGAVGLDTKGSLAAATSTGGIDKSLPGRIGDSCVIGAGCYADNHSCAISGTGDGEFLIRGVVGHTIAMAMELKNMSIQEACDYVIHERNKKIKGSMGVIGISFSGEVGIAFNNEVMRRAWVDETGEVFVKLY